MALVVFVINLTNPATWAVMAVITCALGLHTAYLIWNDTRAERRRRERQFQTRDF
jgi:hypothetical protein